MEGGGDDDSSVASLAALLESSDDDHVDGRGEGGGDIVSRTRLGDPVGDAGGTHVGIGDVANPQGGAHVGNETVAYAEYEVRGVRVRGCSWGSMFCCARRLVAFLKYLQLCDCQGNQPLL